METELVKERVWINIEDCDDFMELYYQRELKDNSIYINPSNASLRKSHIEQVQDRETSYHVNLIDGSFIEINVFSGISLYGQKRYFIDNLTIPVKSWKLKIT